MGSQRFTFPAFSFRRIETPFDKTPGYKNYIALVEVNDLPDLGEWRKINVRDAKLTGSLARDIRESFLTNQETFVFLNRGLVLSVAGVDFNNGSGVLTLRMTDPNVHGLLDGGHSYEIIKQNHAAIHARGEKQFIKLEIIEGFDPQELVKLVDARNSSNQVRDESLMNLAGEFEEIEKVLKDEPYFPKIAFSEYQLMADGTPRPIDIREIISLLMTMDRSGFNAAVHPINTYRSKAACLKYFAANKDAFKRIYPLATDVLKLWDTIHLQLPELYNTVRGETGGVAGGKFGRLTGVTYFNPKSKGFWLEFLGRESRYVIPAGFKYPILGAFRALLEERGRRLVWGKNIDPFEMLAGELGKTLAQTIGEFALDAKNPSKTGKSQLVWQSCYQAAELAYLRMR